jgi:hypothetical protein
VTEINEVGIRIFNAEVPWSPEAQPGEREVIMRQYIALLERQDRLIGRLDTWFGAFGVLICPVVGTPVMLGGRSIPPGRRPRRTACHLMSRGTR